MFFNALATLVAEVEGLDAATVINLGQAARTAGLISKAGRGTAAAHMTWTDAANLLIAVNGSPSLREVPSTIERFRSLRGRAPLVVSGMLEEVVNAGNLGNSLEILLQNSLEQVALERTLMGTMETFTYGKMRETLHNAEAILQSSFEDFTTPSVNLHFLQRSRKVELSIGTHNTRLLHIEWADENSSRQGDLEVTASITGETLRKIAKAIGKDEADR